MFNYHVDPGHGWIEVPFDLISELGLSEKISMSSHRFRGTCYLEEDGDAPLFEKAWKDYYGESEFPVETVRHDMLDSPPCFIRELDSYYV